MIGTKERGLNIDQDGLKRVEYQLDRMSQDAFPNTVHSQAGYFGQIKSDLGGGLELNRYRGDLGQAVTDKRIDGKLERRRERLGDGHTQTTYFDDNEMPYYTREVIREDSKHYKTKGYLHPNTVIYKGDFTAWTDSLGRTSLVKMTDVKFREGQRKRIDLVKGEHYRSGDERGHLIADRFQGPSTPENIVPQSKNINHQQMIKLENHIADLVSQGKKVDYQVQVNHIGKDRRPSSLVPKVTCDGEPHTLPKELRKIYNDTLSPSGRRLTDVREVALGVTAIDGAKSSAALTAAISTVDNISSVIKGDIGLKEVTTDIVKETGTAGVLGYAEGVLTDQVAQQLRASGHQLIRTVGSTAVPAYVISMGIDSYDSFLDYAQGELTAGELAIELGESVTKVVAGGAAQAAAGALLAGAGVTGLAATGGVVLAGAVGVAVSVAAYEAVTSIGGEALEEAGQKVQEMASQLIEDAATHIPEQVESITSAVGDFMASHGLPFGG